MDISIICKIYPVPWTLHAGDNYWVGEVDKHWYCAEWSGKWSMVTTSNGFTDDLTCHPCSMHYVQVRILTLRRIEIVQELRCTNVRKARGENQKITAEDKPKSGCMLPRTLVLLPCIMVHFLRPKECTVCRHKGIVVNMIPLPLPIQERKTNPKNGVVLWYNYSITPCLWTIAHGKE